MSLTKDQKRKRYCGGCRDDFYNGKNPLGIEECWCLKTAKVVWRKIVPLSQVPPWTQKPVRVLDCYMPDRAITVGPKQIH